GPLAAAPRVAALPLAGLAVSGPIALHRRIRTASTDLDRRQRTSPGAGDLETQEERNHDQDAVQDGPAAHQCLPGARAGVAPGSVGVGAPATGVGAPATVVAVTAPDGATIDPGAAAGFDPFASSALGWGASASAGAPSSALACSPSTNPVTSRVADSVRGPLAPGAAPRRLISTNGMASCWPYARPETSSAKGLSSPESVSRTATLR